MRKPTSSESSTQTVTSTLSLVTSDMNTTEAVKSSNSSRHQDTDLDSLSPIPTPYVIGGAVGGGVFLLSLLLLIIIIKRRRRFMRNRTITDVEAKHIKGDRVYVEIQEAKKKKRKKKTKKKTDVDDSDQDNNNGTSAMELVNLDTAPDIITAHDNESIYETLDGRRAARAKAGHVTALNQSENIKSVFPVSGNYPAVDNTYDHLNRFKRSQAPQCPPDLPQKRLTDPEVISRSRVPSIPRAVHSADETTRAMRHAPDADVNCVGMMDVFQPTSSPTDSIKSSLTELARQSASGGKRIVCQLTMVGVVENGKPVPVKACPANNALFILEPRDSEEEGDATSSHSPATKFRIRTETNEDRGVVNEGTKPGSSDYFILEPLDQQEDMDDLVDVSLSQSAIPEDGTVMSRTESFRNARVHSCPDEHCPDESPTLPPRHYRRSFSSPQSSQHKRTRHEDVPAQQRLDAEKLKARIQREMIALGLSSTTENSNTALETNGCVSNNSGDVSCPHTNDYFLLEPQQNSDDEDITGFQFSDRSDSSRGDTKPTQPYHHQQDPSPSQQPAPPLPPKRNGHNRSKSETPIGFLSPDSDDDQGPVIVSLKKSNPSRKNKSDDFAPQASSSGSEDHRQHFRPRFKSESGVRTKRH